MVIAFYIAAIKVLMGRLFSSVIIYKIIKCKEQLLEMPFDKVWVLLPLIDMEKCPQTLLLQQLKAE